MKYSTLMIALLGVLAVCGSRAHATDWILAPSYYSHDPETGRRVTQYAQVGPVYVYPRPDYLKSGYRHMHSAVRGVRGTDHTHVVEQWGRPVRPYGEWRFPYRPYSVPYDLWGPQYDVWASPYGRGPWGPAPYYGSP